MLSIVTLKVLLGLDTAFTNVWATAAGAGISAGLAVSLKTTCTSASVLDAWLLVPEGLKSKRILTSIFLHIFIYY